MNDLPRHDPGLLSEPDRDRRRLAELVGRLIAVHLSNRRRPQHVRAAPPPPDIFIPPAGTRDHGPADG